MKAPHFEKDQFFHHAIRDGTCVIQCDDKEAAKKYRLTLYHFRRIAALKDPRALAVKVSLSGKLITLTFTPEPTILQC